MDRTEMWSDPGALVAQQAEVGLLGSDPWELPERCRVAGCFVAFAPGEEGPGATGDHGWVGAVLLDAGGPSPMAVAGDKAVVVTARAGGPYVPGLLAMREGRMLIRALERLSEVAGRPDVVMVDATGRDHERHCGLAVHLGWATGVPSVGVTHRLLTARDREPPDLPTRGDWAGIVLESDREAGGHDGPEVARWVCTRDGVRPVVAHAGWRTDAATAAELTVRCATQARTPEPLRRAREVARIARSRALSAGGVGSGPLVDRSDQ